MILGSKVPDAFVFMLDSNYFIHQICDIDANISGKSAPIKLYLTLKDRRTGIFKNTKALLKYNFSKSNSWMESCTANYFSDIGILDCETTYHIHQMTRNIIFIEFLENQGTLSSLINDTCLKPYEPI